eukprot:5804560-Amphidinium_carterae.1
MTRYTMCWRRQPPPSELFSSLHAFTEQHFCMIPKGVQANKKTLALQLANFCFNQWNALSPVGRIVPIMDMRDCCHAGAGGDSLPRFDASVSRLLSALGSASLSSSSGSGTVASIGSNGTSGGSSSNRHASPDPPEDLRAGYESQGGPLTQIEEGYSDAHLETPSKRGRTNPIKLNKLRATKDQQTDTNGALVTVLPLPAVRPVIRKSRGRWKRLSDDAILNLREYLLAINQTNEQLTRHDVGIVYDGIIDLACCAFTQEVDPLLKLGREVEGVALFCARCGVVSPLSERS